MISYAQNHEDVLLERCFKSQPDGFYIDVGAWDPVEQSVTHHFSSRGWRGINVEPVSSYFDRLCAARPRDVTLCCVLGDKIGTADFRVIEGSGLSTMRDLDDDFVHELSRGGFRVDVVEVAETTLAEVCAEHVPDGVVIDFLKVDVEGAEDEVLRGADWRAYRPRVLVIEAMSPVGFDVESGWPNVQESTEEWEPLVLANGYLFAATDGLNRFYVREEEPQLLAHFRSPVNIFDDFVSYPTWIADQELARLRGELDRARLSADEAERDYKRFEQEASASLASSTQAVRELESKLQETEARLAELLASTSWRVTAPMRASRDWLRQR